MAGRNDEVLDGISALGLFHADREAAETSGTAEKRHNGRGWLHAAIIIGTLAATVLFGFVSFDHRLVKLTAST